jgi:hypothetical protein
LSRYLTHGKHDSAIHTVAPHAAHPEQEISTPDITNYEVVNIVKVYELDSAIFVEALVCEYTTSSSTYRFDKLEWQALSKVQATAEAIDMLSQSLYDDIEILSHQLEAGMCTQSTQKKILFIVAEDPGAQAILAFGTVLRGGEVNGVVMTS